MLLFSLFLSMYLNKTQAESLSIAPQEGHQLFLSQISSAQKSIEMVMYHLTEFNSVNALLAETNKGVQVRLILNNEVLHATPQKIVDELKAGNVQVKMSSNAFSITHEKAAIFDDNKAIVSSINLTTTANYFRDFGILIDDQNDIAEMKAVFEADWKNADNNGNLTPPLSSKHLVWSPDNSQQKIVELLQSAKSEVVIEVENLGSTNIIDTLTNLVKKGVKVTVLAPACLAGEGDRNRPYLLTLQQAGVDARVSLPPYTTQNPYIHAKAIVVDQTQYFVGSENLSYNSLQKAREVGYINTNSVIAQSIAQVISGDLAISQVVNATQDYQCETVNQINIYSY